MDRYADLDRQCRALSASIADLLAPPMPGEQASRAWGLSFLYALEAVKLSAMATAEHVLPLGARLLAEIAAQRRYAAQCAAWYAESAQDWQDSYEAVVAAS